MKDARKRSAVPATFFSGCTLIFERTLRPSHHHARWRLQTADAATARGGEATCRKAVVATEVREERALEATRLRPFPMMSRDC